MASQGPNSGGTFVSVADPNVAWANPTRVVSSNNQYATAALSDTSPSSEYLRSTNFSFTIPSTATIDGILVEWELSTANVGATEHIADLSVKIVKGGAETGSEKAINEWTATDTYYSYGGSTDLWGTTFTPTNINATDFGASISATWFEDSGLAGSATARIDHVRITVFYTEAGTSRVQVRYLAVLGVGR